MFSLGPGLGLVEVAPDSTPFLGCPVPENAELAALIGPGRALVGELERLIVVSSFQVLLY
jgi:hypothetical protein